MSEDKKLEKPKKVELTEEQKQEQQNKKKYAVPTEKVVADLKSKDVELGGVWFEISSVEGGKVTLSRKFYR